MTSPIIEIDLGGNGGKFAPRDAAEVRDWLEVERDFWAPLLAADPTSAQHFEGRLTKLSNILNQFSTDPATAQTNLRNFMNSTYANDPPLAVHSTSSRARLLREIAVEERPAEAARAYGALVGANQVDLRRTADLRSLMLLTFPDMAEPSKTVQTIRDERAQLKRDLIRFRNDITKHLDVQTSTWNEELERTQRLRWRAARHVLGSARREQKARLDATAEALEKIEQTDRTFSEFMALAAPVKYWKDKASTHRQSGDAARAILLNFTCLAVLGVAIAFVIAGVAVLEAAGFDAAPFMKVKVPEGREVPTALFVVVSGALAALSSTAFWAGKILVRNLLTERHLERDARERSVMTETYLALLESKGATEEERLVILNALFRASSDGTSKDDGPSSVSSHALLAKLLEKTK